MTSVKHGHTIAWFAALLIAGALVASCATASDQGIPDLDQRATALNKTIMCPVCPGESIDQSQNSLAVQMRAIVHEKLAEGWSEQQVKDFLVERYGPSVLLEPPTTGFSLAAWILPPVAFALAIAALLLTLKWMRMSAAASAESAVGEDNEHRDYVSRIDDALRSESRSDLPPTSREDEQQRGKAQR